jgi:hypothetical protein
MWRAQVVKQLTYLLTLKDETFIMPFLMHNTMNAIPSERDAGIWFMLTSHASTGIMNTQQIVWHNFFLSSRLIVLARKMSSVGDQTH